jgi:hypothetical protein
MKRIFLCTLLLAFLFPAKSAFATTFYVDDTGSGTNCTQAQNSSTRHNTIAEGIACLTATAGDTLIIGNGTYNETICDTVPSGSAGTPTIIKSENANGAILQPASGCSGIAVHVVNNNYITFDGLDVNSNNVSGAMPYWVQNSLGITIKNGTARNGLGMYSSCIEFEGGSSGGRIANMLLHDCGQIADILAHGVYVDGPNNIIEDNIIHDVDGFCVQLYDGSTPPDGNIVRRNYMYNCAQLGGILVSGDSTAYNNIVTDSPIGITVWTDGNGATVYNNTIYNNSIYCMRTFSGGTGAILRNNICYMNTDAVDDQGATTSCTYNLGVSGGEGAANSCSTANSATNPNFVNAAMGDFHLNSGSPAEGAAFVLSSVFTDDFDLVTRGVVWDQGAYEVTGAGTLDFDIFVSTTVQ